MMLFGAKYGSFTQKQLNQIKKLHKKLLTKQGQDIAEKNKKDLWKVGRCKVLNKTVYKSKATENCISRLRRKLKRELAKLLEEYK